MPQSLLGAGPSPGALPAPSRSQSCSNGSWFCRAEHGHGVEGWARSLLLFFFYPSSLPNGLFSAPNGFCLTNGVSFLQRYDPGLVVVMVNLAVVIFYFQTELLLCHQCTNVRLTFSVVAIILLLGLSFSFPFLSLCTLVWSLFIKGYC